MWADPKTRGTPPPGVICTACGQRIDYHAINPNYRPPRSRYDMIGTYDGDTLVSPRLQDYLERHGGPGLRFVPLPRSDRYVAVMTSNVLRLIPPVTLQKAEYCEVCKQYKSVWGLPMVNDKWHLRFEGIEGPIRSGWYETDLIAGYGPTMGPDVIVGIDLWEDMVARGFKGVHGLPVVDDPPVGWPPAWLAKDWAEADLRRRSQS
jgi:hypothetical protein